MPNRTYSIESSPLARSIEDAALAMNALAGRDPRDCTSRQERGFSAFQFNSLTHWTY